MAKNRAKDRLSEDISKGNSEGKRAKQPGKKHLEVEFNRPPFVETTPKGTSNNIVPGFRILNTEPNKYSWEMWSAISDGDIAKLKTYLDLGGDPNSIYRSEPVLIRAANNQKKDMVQLLLMYGADVNIKNNFNETPLMRAIMDEQRREGPEAGPIRDVCRILLEYGADVNAQSNDGHTALIVNSKRSKDLETYKLLINAGAEINLQNNEKETALSIAVYRTDKMDDILTIKYLLSKGASPLLKTKWRKNAIDYAKEKRGPLYKILIKYNPLWIRCGGQRGYNKFMSEFKSAIENCKPDNVKEIFTGL